MRQQSFFLLSFVFLMGCATTQSPVKPHSPAIFNAPVPLRVIEESKPFSLENVALEPKSTPRDINTTTHSKQATAPKKTLIKKSKPKKMATKKSKVNKAVASVKRKHSHKKSKKKPVASAKKTTIEKVVSSSNDKLVIGSVETVRIIPGNMIASARVDTGAKTTSLHAVNMQTFERDGRKYVRFALSDDENALTIERPIWKWVRIKRHGEKSQRRPVVKLRIVLGDNDQLVAVTLTDRGKFKNPVLIGRNFLRNIYIVDVSKQQTCTPKEYRK